MPAEYDRQLLESVAVRRRRVRDALLFGAGRARRTVEENLGTLFAGFAVAGLLCAGCVGWAFLQAQLHGHGAVQLHVDVTPTGRP